MRYFADCQTVAQAKTEYRRLAMLHHPDRGGDTATMQAINAAYEKLLARLDGETITGTDGREHTYRYNAEHERAVMDKLGELIKADLPGVTVRLIGTWLWAEGDTKAHRETLKAKDGLSMTWHNKRTAWYWQPSGYKKSRYNSRASLDDLQHTYGGRDFRQADDEAKPKRKARQLA